MNKRKVQIPSAAVVWPYTPDPSPHLEPSTISFEVDDQFAMAHEETARAKPISMAARREGLMSPGRPTLEDVLNNKAPNPYTLAAYTAFLSQQHCLETLEFTTEARKYRDKYDEIAANLAGMPLTIDTDEGFELIQDWGRILDVYVKPGAPREINLPAEERDDMIDFPCSLRPPPPEALDPSVKRMYDLMSGSIFIPFCNSLKTVSQAQTFNAISDWADRNEQMDSSRMTYDDRTGMTRRAGSRRQRSPPQTSAGSFQPSRSPPSQQPRPTHSSSLSSALSRQSANRLSTHVSNSSAASESALTDSSGTTGESPNPGEYEAVMTPPTTPPTSELGGSSAIYHGGLLGQTNKTQRSESGGWKKMGMKIFGQNKKRGGSSD